MNYIPYGRQSISEEDIKVVEQVLRSDWLTQGPFIDQFESAVANYCGAKHAVAVSNGTVALHLACIALDVGSGDSVWTSPNTFVASANCALYCGAEIDFVDICPETYNMSADALSEKLIAAEKNGKLPKVVIPVHFAGQSCEMRRIKQLSEKYGFKIIEDASHAIGGSYNDKKIGSCFYSDITVFSFHPVKVITTGEGGMCVTNNSEIAKKLALFRTHGITRDAERMSKESEGAWYYEQLELGYNYRITDLQCALGLSQLSRLDDFVNQRNLIAEKYNHALKKLPLKSPIVLKENRCAFHLYVIQVLEESGKTRRDVFDFFKKNKIGVNVHYIPVHTQPYYQKIGFKSSDFPNTQKYYSRAISIPIYSGLLINEQDYVIEKIKESMQ